MQLLGIISSGYLGIMVWVMGFDLTTWQAWAAIVPVAIINGILSRRR